MANGNRKPKCSPISFLYASSSLHCRLLRYVKELPTPTCTGRIHGVQPKETASVTVRDGGYAYLLDGSRMEMRLWRGPS